jgi:hypothetical protein
MVAETLTRLGDIQLTLRQPAEAVSSYERALAVWQHADGGERKLAPIRFALARALRQTGADSKRALSLARQAREDLAQLDPSSPTLRELDAWLAARDDPGGH